MSASADRELCLLLPAMSLNASVFPPLPAPSLEVDYEELLAGSPTLPEVARRLGRWLERAPAWTDAPARVLVGHSFGALLAIEYVLSFAPSSAERLALLLIAGSPGPLYERVRLRAGRLFGRELRIPMARFMSIWNLPAVNRLVKRLHCRGSLESTRVDFGALADRSDIAVDSAGWRNTDWRLMRALRLAARGFDARPRLHEIQLPTIVLHGGRDALFTTGDAEALARGIPSAELRLLPDAAHALPLTHPEAVVRAVEDLLARL